MTQSCHQWSLGSHKTNETMDLLYRFNVVSNRTQVTWKIVWQLRGCSSSPIQTNFGVTRCVGLIEEIKLQYHEMYCLRGMFECRGCSYEWFRWARRYQDVYEHCFEVFMLNANSNSSGKSNINRWTAYYLCANCTILNFNEARHGWTSFVQLYTLSTYIVRSNIQIDL